MEEKKVTDEEVITALRKQPAYDTVLWLEKGINATDILNLIHRLQIENETLKSNKFASWKLKFFNAQAEIEAWKAKSRELEQSWEIASSNEEKLQKQVDEQKAEIKRLTEENKNLKYSLDTANGYIKKLAESCETNCEKFNGITTQQAVKYTVKEIADWLDNEKGYCGLGYLLKKRYGVEVE